MAANDYPQSIGCDDSSMATARAAVNAAIRRLVDARATLGQYNNSIMLAAERIAQSKGLRATRTPASATRTDGIVKLVFSNGGGDGGHNLTPGRQLYVASPSSSQSYGTRFSGSFRVDTVDGANVYYKQEGANASGTITSVGVWDADGVIQSAITGLTGAPQFSNFTDPDYFQIGARLECCEPWDTVEKLEIAFAYMPQASGGYATDTATHKFSTISRFQHYRRAMRGTINRQYETFVNYLRASSYWQVYNRLLSHYESLRQIGFAKGYSEQVKRVAQSAIDSGREQGRLPFYQGFTAAMAKVNFEASMGQDWMIAFRLGTASPLPYRGAFDLLRTFENIDHARAEIVNSIVAPLPVPMTRRPRDDANCIDDVRLNHCDVCIEDCGSLTSRSRSSSSPSSSSSSRQSSSSTMTSSCWGVWYYTDDCIIRYAGARCLTASDGRPRNEWFIGVDDGVNRLMIFVPPDVRVAGDGTCSGTFCDSHYTQASFTAPAYPSTTLIGQIYPYCLSSSSSQSKSSTSPSASMSKSKTSQSTINQCFGRWAYDCEKCTVAFTTPVCRPLPVDATPLNQWFEETSSNGDGQSKELVIYTSAIEQRTCASAGSCPQTGGGYAYPGPPSADLLAQYCPTCASSSSGQRSSDSKASGTSQPSTTTPGGSTGLDSSSVTSATTSQQSRTSQASGGACVDVIKGGTLTMDTVFDKATCSITIMPRYQTVSVVSCQQTNG